MIFIPPNAYKTPYSKLVKRSVRPQTEAKIRRYGTKQFRQGTHPQMWRVDRLVGPRKAVKGIGANLGPMGALGDHRIIEIHLNPIQFSYLNALGFQFTKQRIEYLITRDVMIPLRRMIIAKMKEIVPVDGGALLMSMIKSVSGFIFSSNIATFPFIMVLNTKDVPYGKVVNNMPDSWIKHPGRHTNRLGRSGNALYDPYAEYNFYNKIMKYGQYNAEKLWKNFRRDFENLLPQMKRFTTKNTNNYKFVSSLFRVKFKGK